MYHNDTMGLFDATAPIAKTEKKTTLSAARAQVFALLPQGSRCPCCDQFAKRYKRSISGAVSRSLIKMFLEYDRDYFHITSIRSSGGGDFAKLRYWGLVEEKEKDGAKDTRTSGFWRLTDSGVLFVNNELTVPKYVYTYNGIVSSFSEGITVTIEQTLGKKFSYSELMGYAKH